MLFRSVVCIHRKCIHGVDDYRPMVHCIRDLPRLRHLELNLAGNVLGHQCGYILGSLCLSTSIEVLMLNLSDCDLHDVARGPHHAHRIMLPVLDVNDLCYIVQGPRLREFRLWMCNNHITDAGVQNLMHHLDGATRLQYVYVDLTRNLVGLYGLLVAQEYRNRHPSFTIAYLPLPGLRSDH